MKNSGSERSLAVEILAIKRSDKSYLVPYTWECGDKGHKADNNNDTPQGAAHLSAQQSGREKNRERRVEGGEDERGEMVVSTVN